MNFQFSIIIICKNEAQNIEQTIRSILFLSDDIIVYDSGSSDGTLEIVKKFPVRLYKGTWDGFGRTRQKAAELSNYGWVFVIDADEIASKELIEEIQKLKLDDSHFAYSIQLQFYIEKTHIKWGVWHNDFRIRLYNKNILRWNASMIHEKLITHQDVIIKKLKNPIIHRTVNNYDELRKKMKEYAVLTAQQYFENGKRSNLANRSLAPIYAFIKSYFLKKGFIDGVSGYRLAQIIARYTRLKYFYLHQLQSTKLN